jgi:hypothetical protein
MANLDKLAAQHAQRIIRNTNDRKKSDVENVLTKSLGVIQEQGIYAGMLYLLSRGDKERPIAMAVRSELVGLLRESDLAPFGLAYSGNLDDEQAVLDHFADRVCSASVQTILFIKELFEQTLTYGRYGAKARLDEPDQNAASALEG